MPKNWMLLSCILLLGSAGTSDATPLDSPDIVYIDGMPCNSLCQSYLAWSRHASSMSGPPASAQPAPLAPNAEARHLTSAAIRGEKSKPAAHVRVAKQGVPNSREMPRARIAGLQPASNGDSDTARAKIAVPHPAGGAAATPEKLAQPHPAGDAAGGTNTRTIQAQVTAATEIAERMTVATAVTPPEPNANDRAKTALPKDAEKSSSAPADDTDRLVAVLMAGPEIKSVSDLASKKIAVDDRQSAYSASVRTAVAAAGAAEVQLSEGQTKAIERLVGGEVSAAVLALVSPEAAEAFPEVAGFTIFRIPLSPR